MSEGVTELPPEVKLEMAQSSLWSFIFASWAKAIDNTAGESFYKRYEKWYDDLWPVAEALMRSGTKETIDNLKIPGNDCITVAKAHQIMDEISLGNSPKIIEMTPEKAVVHEPKCRMMEAAKNVFPKYLDLPVEKMACTAADTIMGTTVNPKITFRHGETICKGGTFCERIWELKK